MKIDIDTSQGASTHDIDRIDRVLVTLSDGHELVIEEDPTGSLEIRSLQTSLLLECRAGNTVRIRRPD